MFAVLGWLLGFGAFAVDAASARPDDLAGRTDAVVVLTGGANRIEEGLRLFATGSAPHLFISGVHESVDVDSIKAMWKGSIDLPDCCLTLGHSASNTMDNASETRRWLEENEIKSIRLVTSNYHMRRSLLEFSEAMPDIEIIRHPVLPERLETWSAPFWSLAFREYHKTLLTWVRQRLALTPTFTKIQ